MKSKIKSKLVLLWAKNHVKKAQTYKNNAQTDQQELLVSLLKKGKNTLFGRQYGFENIKNHSDFVKKVPIQDYEKMKCYIEAIQKGDKDVLWKGKPIYFAKTSGTTSGSKSIPISKEGMSYQINAAKSAILHYIAQSNCTQFTNGKMIFLQGSPELSLQNGISVGRLSGIVAHHIPKYLQNNRLPSYKVNCLEDWETKLDKIIEETETQNMTLISGIPPWLIMYFEKLKAKHQKPIGKLFPNLQLIITGGVNYEPYRLKMEELLSKKIDIIQTFPASEGFFAFQDDYKNEGLLLLTQHGIFYEFVSMDELHKESPIRLGLHEVELHTDYALIITTNSGLWAYNIGDVVRFISKNPYRILVSGRTKHYTSAFGEHVIAFEVEKAMESALKQHSALVTDFHLAPQVTPVMGLPYHEWFVEFDQEPTDIHAFINTLDAALCQCNSYYNDLIKGHVLQKLKLSFLKPNAFLELAKNEGKLGGQNKLARLANDRSVAEKLEKWVFKSL